MAAIEYCRALRSVPVNEIQVGWLFYVMPGPFGNGGWQIVTEVGEDGGSKWGKKNEATGETEWMPYFNVTTAKSGQGFCHSTDKATAIPDRAALKETTRKALEYQATLNKQGKVSKRAAKAAA